MVSRVKSKETWKFGCGTVASDEAGIMSTVASLLWEGRRYSVFAMRRSIGREYRL